MARSKKILITSETHEKAVLKRYRQTESQAYCGECGQETETLSLNQAAALLSVPWTEVISRVASGEFHTAGTDERCLAICVRSLSIERDQADKKKGPALPGTNDEK